MKIRTTAVIAAGIAMLAGPTSASAGDFFVGGSIGKASLNEDFDGLVVDDDSTAFRIVGGWQFNDYFALEAGYHDFGDFTQDFVDGGDTTRVSLSADGFTFGAAGSLPLGDRFALTGRVGAFFWNGSAEINDISQAKPEDNNLFLGLGASVDLTDHFLLTADWTRYELEDATSGVFSVGVRYQF